MTICLTRPEVLRESAYINEKWGQVMTTEQGDPLAEVRGEVAYEGGNYLHPTT